MLPKRLLKRYAFRVLLCGILFWLCIGIYNSLGTDLTKDADKQLSDKKHNAVEMNQDINIIERDFESIKGPLKSKLNVVNNVIEPLDVIRVRTKANDNGGRDDFLEKFHKAKDATLGTTIKEVHRDEEEKEAANKSGGNREKDQEENKEENVAQIAPPNDKKQRGNENGPGENGEPVIIDTSKLTREQKADYDKGWQMNAFNRYASDMISIHRSLPDVRHPACKEIQYSDNLPDACVIIIFHNEAWSVLLRTVHSVLDRSESKLLKQIILVDDASYFDHLKDPLQDYVDKLDKVTLVRAQERTGLIRARLMGFDKCTAEVAIFLDSHCEATEGWLVPFLSRISENTSTVLVPVIDGINADNFRYEMFVSEFYEAGGFSWNLIFNWHKPPIKDRERLKRSKPARYYGGL